MSNSAGEFFKEWAIPGPRIPEGRIESENLGPREGETLDALSGYFKILQLKKGHRFSTDDVLVAWYGTTGSSAVRRVLDLGSGIGSVGMMAAWRLPGARFTTVEAQPESVELARRSARINGLEDRYEIREGDFRDPAVLPAPGNADERYDLVLGSPPYFPLDSGIHGDHPQKIACRFEVRGDVSDYCKTASAQLSRGGVFACIFPVEPAHQEVRVREAAQRSGLSIVRRRPVVLREGEAPLLELFLMMRAHDLPPRMRDQTWQEPSLTIRTSRGEVHPEYAAIKLTLGFPP